MGEDHGNRGSERDTLIEKVNPLHEELEQAIQSHTPMAPEMIGSASDEPVLQELEILLERKVGVAPNEADWQAAVKEGNARVARRDGSHPDRRTGHTIDG
ncbi:MAG: PIN-like domain-containing protein [Pseudonocardiaceae bacterium]